MDGSSTQFWFDGAPFALLESPVADGADYWFNAFPFADMAKGLPPNNYVLAVEPGTYVVTGQKVMLNSTFRNGSYAITGQPATLSKTTLTFKKPCGMELGSTTKYVNLDSPGFYVDLEEC